MVPSYARSRASRGNTETSADFGCLNITFLVSFVPSSSYDRSISKHPILKPDGARHGTLLRNEPVGPWRISGDPLVYLAEVAGLVSYTSAISSGKCGGTRKITQDARGDVVSPENVRQLNSFLRSQKHRQFTIDFKNTKI